jgi:hypothetical protein
VFQTAGVPPSRGSIILASMGSTTKSRAALRNIEMVKMTTSMEEMLRVFGRPWLGKDDDSPNLTTEIAGLSH